MAGDGYLDAMRQLCGIWRQDAERIRRYHPDSEAAAFLERCAEDAEGVLHQSTPEWISLAQVQARTGWGPKKLRRDFRELAEERVPGTQIPLARLSPRWEVHRSALERIRPKPGRVDIAPVRTDDLESLSRTLAAEGGD